METTDKRKEIFEEFNIPGDATMVVSAKKI